MHNIGMILTALAMLGLVIFMAPSVLARNRGKILRNIAIWLAIFVVLGLLYQNFGPNKGMPMHMMQSGDAPNHPPPAAGAPAGGKSFTPPAE